MRSKVEERVKKANRTQKMLGLSPKQIYRALISVVRSNYKLLAIGKAAGTVLNMNGK